MARLKVCFSTEKQRSTIASIGGHRDSLIHLLMHRKSTSPRFSTDDKGVVRCTIWCGTCFFWKHDLWSACENTKPNGWMLEAMYGYTGAALFGYSHLYGGFAGGQAHYARVPFADVGPIKVANGLNDE